MKSDKGFLLIDLILVLILILIIISIPIIKFDLINNFKANIELKSISIDLNKMRLYSINEPNLYRMKIKENGKEYIIKCKNIKKNSIETIYIKKLNYITILNPTEISFNKSISPDKGYTMHIKYKNKKAQIKIAVATGNIRIVK